MSDEEGLEVHVLAVSAAPGRRDEAMGDAIASALATAGHRVADHVEVAAEADQVRDAVIAIASAGAQALLIVGGTTPFEGSVTVDALRPLLCPRFDGFNTIFQPLWHQRAGHQAVWVDLTAGLVGSTAVFALPPSAEAVDLALRELIAPQLAAAVGVGVLHGGEVPAPPARGTSGEVAFDLGPDPVTQEAEFEEVEDVAGEPVDRDDEASDEAGDDGTAAASDEPPPLPAPSGSLGQLGRDGLTFLLAGHGESEAAPPDEDPAKARSGWLRAVREVEGTVSLDKREELPQPVEKLAPFIEVLHNAGETGVLTLPSGVKYSVWGYPDLRRATSKVLAVGWGRPLVELIALHRYPVLTGTCLEQEHGLLPHASADVGETAEAVTGSAPREPGGQLFAVEGDAVWILRDGKVFRFDGRKEHAMGTPKQALVSLALAWSTR